MICYDKLIELNPNDYAIYYLKGNIYLKDSLALWNIGTHERHKKNSGKTATKKLKNVKLNKFENFLKFQMQLQQ